MKPVFWLGAVLAAVSIACGGEKRDVVVGAVVVCAEGRLTGDACKAASGTNVGIAWRVGTQKELTVKTAKGTTYTVLVDADDAVKLGDEWPPK